MRIHDYRICRSGALEYSLFLYRAVQFLTNSLHRRKKYHSITRTHKGVYMIIEYAVAGPIYNRKHLNLIPVVFILVRLDCAEL